jgi:hypothetical protein
LGKFFREVKEAPALPFGADALRKPAGISKGNPEGFGIVAAGGREGLRDTHGSISFKRISARCYES